MSNAAKPSVVRYKRVELEQAIEARQVIGTLHSDPVEREREHSLNPARLTVGRGEPEKSRTFRELP